jgi:hypothetical protein
MSRERLTPDNDGGVGSVAEPANPQQTDPDESGTAWRFDPFTGAV